MIGNVYILVLWEKEPGTILGPSKRTAAQRKLEDNDDG